MHFHFFPINKLTSLHAGMCEINICDTELTLISIYTAQGMQFTACRRLTLYMIAFYLTINNTASLWTNIFLDHNKKRERQHVKTK